MVEARLRQARIQLTMGGEPTVVPISPEGAEWNVAADGPTKLGYARALAAELQHRVWPGSTLIFCPGKRYDGEVNPRWTLRLLQRADGEPLVDWMLHSSAADRDAMQALPVPDEDAIEQLLVAIGLCLGCTLHPLPLRDPRDPSRRVWAVPLAWDQQQWHALEWRLEPEHCQLSLATGPAGLRLPLEHFPADALAQVLTVERHASGWALFLPPVPREPFEQLLLALAASSGRCCPPELSGVLPLDIEGHWQVLGLTADPGVLEINLPVCHSWKAYADWLALLEQAGAAVGLCSSKVQGERTQGTGGGNHLLLGGPSLSQHPFFTRPGWLVAIVRYWQHHPALAYLFSGNSVGPASQAPRCDEGSASRLDLELAHRLLDGLDDADHRVAIGETLRHLHADRSGNTHRSEISLDKFWNPAWSAGCQGLLEFRAIETMPHHHWSAAVALLVRALAVMLLDPSRRPSGLRNWGAALHDRALLPTQLMADLKQLLADLDEAGLPLPLEPFEAIWEWRFPLLLHWRQGEAELSIRQALEPWPLLCDVPVEGGSTSRFVDSSLRRFEVIANPAFWRDHRLTVSGRPLPGPADPAEPVALRYRQEALYPCLHPLLPIHLPLRLDLTAAASGFPLAAWMLQSEAAGFQALAQDNSPLPVVSEAAPEPAVPGLCTRDLRF